MKCANCFVYLAAPRSTLCERCLKVVAKLINKKMKTVAVDFDGTCVTHEYPEVGLDVPYCVEVLKRLEMNGVKIILWTMRSGEKLDDAKLWFENKKIALFGVNKNPTQKTWTDSPKAYAQFYIDDAAAGCPLIETSGRPMVDWKAIEKILQKENFL